MKTPFFKTLKLVIQTRGIYQKSLVVFIYIKLVIKPRGIYQKSLVIFKD